MRSKEVEDAIHRLTFDKKFVLNGGNNIITSADTIDTVLSYIETLEQLPNKIRDKIKELKEKTVIAQGEELLILEAKIDMLEEIIGE